MLRSLIAPRALVVLPLVLTGALAGCRSNAEYPVWYGSGGSTAQPGGDVDGDRGSGGRKGTGGARATGGTTGGGTPTLPVRDGSASDTPAPATDGPAAEVPVTMPPPGPVPGRSYVLKETALWRGNAAAAYTILHEAVCEGAFLGSIDKADPELKKRGLTGAFSVITGACTSGNRWPKIKAMYDAGHEILNQTASHVCLGQSAAQCGPMVPRSADFAKEIDGATTELKNRLGIMEPGVFVFPYDVCAANAVTHLKGKGFLGARCGPGKMNGNGFTDPFAVKFDLWGPGVSQYANGAPCNNLMPNAAPTAASAACRTHVLNAPLDEAVKQKGWFVRTFHGFQGDSGTYQPVALGDYASHLDVVAGKVKDGSLWVAGPNQVVKYRFARQHCTGANVVGSAVAFPAPNPDCVKYATLLSYVITTSDDAASVSATQAGVRRAGKKIGPSTFVIEADPSKGEAALTD